MASINKNFVIKNGLEVDSKTLYVDANTNRVGIGSTIPTRDLDVVGDAAVQGTITTPSIVVGVATAGTVGVSTLTATSITGTAATITSVTCQSFTVVGSSAIGNGAEDEIALNGEITTNIIPDADSILDFGYFNRRWRDIHLGRNINASTLVGFGLSVGVGTARSYVAKELVISGFSTFTSGPVVVGSGTSTGTVLQPLQVTGGAYVSGSVGLGTTNPTSKLHVIGDTLITGVSTATTFNGNINAGVGTITSVTGTTATYTNGDFAVLDGDVFFSNTGIITSLTGTKAKYTTVDGDTFFSNTGIVTSLTGTKAKYTTLDGNTLFSNTGIVTTISGTTATYTNGDFAVLDGNSLFSNTGIVTTISGTTATYTNGDFAVLDGNTLFSNTGIVTSLTGTKAKYTTLDGDVFFSNTGIITSLTGTKAKYTTLDGDVFFSNTGIVTSLTGTTATYTNGDFAVLDGNSLFSNTGIVTTISGTTATYTNGDFAVLDGDVFFSNTGIITSLTGTKAKYTTLDGDVFFSNTGIVTSLTGTTATYTNGDFAVLDGNTLFSNTGIVTSLTGAKAKYTTLDGNTFFSNTGIVTSLTGTTATYTNGDFAVLDGNTLFSNTGIVTSLTGTTATYTNGDFAVLDGDTFFSNTGIITSLTGTKAKYTTLDGNTLFSNTGIVTTISGTKAKYTTLDGDVFFSNTGIVTTISGTTATYTNGDFAVLDGNSLFSNTGIITSLTGANLNFSGLSTVSLLTGTTANFIGVGTFGSLSIGATSVISSNRQLQNIASLDSTTLSVIAAGVAASPNNFVNLTVIGISTFINGPILVGSGTTTGTASQSVQVTGGAYVSGNTGIGITNPTSKLHVIGNTLVSGVSTATTFNGNINAGVGTITSVTGTTATYTNGDFAVLDGNSLFSNTGIVTTISGTTATYTNGDFAVLDGNSLFSNTGIVTTISGTKAKYTTLDGNTLFSNTGIVTTISGTTATYTNGDFAVLDGNSLFSNTGIITSLTGTKAKYTTLDGDVFFSNTGIITSLTGTKAKYTTLDGNTLFSNTGIVTTISGTTATYTNGDFAVLDGNSLFSNTGIVTTISGTTATYTNGDFAVLDGATTYANVGVVTTISGTNLNYTGVGTITRLNATNLSVTGISTFTNGPVLVGSVTPTGTASQPLQVTGGAYVSGSVGIGTTNPLNQLHLSSTTPLIRFTETDAAADNQTWITGPNGQIFNWQALTDAGPGGGNYFRMTRSAQQIQTFEGLLSGTPWFAVNNANRDVYLDPGSLGIGTTTPATSLHLYATTGVGGIYIEDSSISQAAPLIRLNGKRSDGNTSLAFSGRIVFDGQRTDAAVGANKALGGLIFGGNYDTTPNYAYSSFITSIAESAWTGVNTCPSALVFYTSGIGQTNPDAAVNFGTERMRISSSGDVLVGSATSTGTATQRLQVTGGAYVSGNLGLGITNPTSKLHIVGDTLVTGVSTATSIVVGSGVTINASGINAGVGIITATKFSTGADGAAINIEATRITGPTELIIDPQNIADNTGRVRIKGDLFVDGSQFVVNSGTIELADFVVGIATTVTSNAVLDGAGIAIGNSSITSKTLTYSFGSSALKSSENFDLLTGKTYKINGTDVLSSTTLGSAVVNSSLTSVGTLEQLGVTGISTFTNGPVFIGAATSTGTATQRLQVSGGAYVSGNLGIGITNPSTKLHISGGDVTLGTGVTITGATANTFVANINGSERFLIDSVGRTRFNGETGAQSGNSAVFIGAGSTQINGFHNRATIVTDATYSSFISWPVIANNTLVDEVKHFVALRAVPGTATTLTSSYGFYADNFLASVATNTYGFYGGIANAANRWNFYASGTAPNYFSGSVGLGITNPTSKLHVVGDALVTGVSTATTVNATTLQIGGVSVTSTAAELNILDGVTSTAAELNLVDGSVAGTIVNSKAVIYGAAGQVNATTLQIGGVSVTSTAAELNLLDTSVAGAIVNSKAVIYGAAGQVNATTLQIGGVSVTSTAAELNILDGVTSTAAELNLVDTSVAGTVVNSKAVIYSAAGQVGVAAGSAAAPGVFFSGDTNTGMFLVAADSLGFSAGTVDVARFDTGGTSGRRQLYFPATAEVWSAATLFLEAVDNVRSVTIAANTTASASNVSINSSSGVLFRSTSSIKYKTDVEDADLSYSEALVYGSRPVWYRSLSKNDPSDYSYWGFIAEEVAEIDPRMVHWGDDGPEGVQYDRYVVHLVSVIQKQKQQLDAIEARLTAAGI